MKTKIWPYIVDIEYVLCTRLPDNLTSILPYYLTISSITRMLKNEND